jgi:hypothetical protein
MHALLVSFVNWERKALLVNLDAVVSLLLLVAIQLSLHQEEEEEAMCCCMSVVTVTYLTMHGFLQFKS